MAAYEVSRRFASIAGALALGATLTFGVGAQAQAEKLRLGNEGVYPPFSMVDSTGKLTGVEPDLAREMCKRMKVECDIVVMDFKALIPSMLQGKFDAIVTQIAPTPERKEKVLFGVPVVYNPGIFVMRKDATYDPTTKEGVAGKGLKIGLQRGAAMVSYVKDRYGDAFEYVYYDNPDQIRLDLLAGRIDLTFDSKINWTLELIMKPEGKDYKLAGGDRWVGDANVPEGERGYSWITQKKDKALLDRMSATLTEMIKDCTYTKIRQQYLEITTLPAEDACVSKTN